MSQELLSSIIAKLKLAAKTEYFEEGSILYKLKENSTAAVLEKVIEEIKPLTEPEEKLPFIPQRRVLTKATPSKSLHLEKTKKEAPEIKQEVSEKPTESLFDRFEDMKLLLKKIAPNFPILDKLPDDKEAALISKQYENNIKLPHVMVFYDEGLKEYHTFLKALVNAIDKRFFSCELVPIDALEQQDLLDSILKEKKLKLTICPSELLWHHPKLMSHYRELPGQQIKRLGTKDLLVLSQLNYYMKDPLLKRSLWNTLMAYFKTP